MIDWWQTFFGRQSDDFSPGGGTFRPQVPTLNPPFAPRTGSDWLGPPSPYGGQTFPNDDRMAFNPDIGIPYNLGGRGEDLKMYDEGEIQDLVSSLRGSSPESLPNPAPADNYFPGVPYGQPPDIPTYPPSDNAFPGGGYSPGDLFNPNRVPAPGMDTISMQGTGAADFPFGAPDVTPIPEPPGGYTGGSDFNPTPMETFDQNALGRGITPMPTDIYQDVYGGGGYTNLAPNESMSPTPNDVYQPPDVYNSAPNEAMYPTNPDYPAGTEATYYPSPDTGPSYNPVQLPGISDNFDIPSGGWENLQREGTSTAGSVAYQDPTTPAAYDPGSVNVNLTNSASMTGAQWPFYIDQFPTPPDDTGAGAPATSQPQAPAGPVNAPYQTPNTGANLLPGSNPYSYGPPSTPQGPLAPGNMGAMGPNQQPIIDPTTGLPVAGSILSESDVAKRYNMQQFNDPRYKPSDLLHPGQTFVKLLSDGTRVVVDATGKIISGGIQAGKDLYNNILNDPRNTGSDYLASIGYQPGQGYKSQFPASVTGPSAGFFDTSLGGVAGQGASFFHGSQISAGTLDPNTGQPVMDVPTPSAMNPGGYNYPRHGATSVAGAFSNLGGMGTMANITALSGDILARKRLREIAQVYAANPNARITGHDTRASVGGPPPNVWSPWVLQQHPFYTVGQQGLPYSGGTPIVNPGAFSSTGVSSPNLRSSIHFGPKSTP